MNKLLLVTLILCALAAWKTALSAEHYCVMTHCYYTSQDAGECAIDARWMGSRPDALVAYGAKTVLCFPEEVNPLPIHAESGEELINLLKRKKNGQNPTALPPNP